MWSRLLDANPNLAVSNPCCFDRPTGGHTDTLTIEAGERHWSASWTCCQHKVFMCQCFCQHWCPCNFAVWTVLFVHQRADVANVQIEARETDGEQMMFLTVHTMTFFYWHRSIGWHGDLKAFVKGHRGTITKHFTFAGYLHCVALQELHLTFFRELQWSQGCCCRRQPFLGQVTRGTPLLQCQIFLSSRTPVSSSSRNCFCEHLRCWKWFVKILLSVWSVVLSNC